LILQWQQLDVKQIAVVVARGNEVVEEELNRLGVEKTNRIINPAPDQGMFSSIQCAASWAGWTEEITHWIVALGDQPQLNPKTLERLLQFAEEGPEKICQPLRLGKPKHPVGFPRSHFASLATSKAADLKEFLSERTGALAGFESDDPGLDFDIDTPQDYEQVRRRFET
jgi:molybdenum cofactor cytidylyltransferase